MDAPPIEVGLRRLSTSQAALSPIHQGSDQGIYLDVLPMPSMVALLVVATDPQSHEVDGNELGRLGSDIHRTITNVARHRCTRWIDARSARSGDIRRVMVTSDCCDTQWQSLLYYVRGE